MEIVWVKEVPERKPTGHLQLFAEGLKEQPGEWGTLSATYHSMSVVYNLRKNYPDHEFEGRRVNAYGSCYRVYGRYVGPVPEEPVVFSTPAEFAAFLETYTASLTTARKARRTKSNA